MRLDEISRLPILFLVRSQHVTQLGQVKGQIFAKMTFLDLLARSGVSICRSDLKHPPSCFLFTYEYDTVLLLYPVAIFSIRSAPK